MGNFTDICRDIRNLTCRPRDNLTFKKELERQCHVQMLILLVAAFIVGCLLMITIRTINKYWCALGRRRIPNLYLKEGQIEVTITLLP